jgi:hypothetical protein
VWNITIKLLAEKTHVNFNKQIFMENVITLIWDLRPSLRYKGGSGPRKCNGIQTHPHKCESESQMVVLVWELESYNFESLDQKCR